MADTAHHANSKEDMLLPEAVVMVALVQDLNMVALREGADTAALRGEDPVAVFSEAVPLEEALVDVPP